MPPSFESMEPMAVTSFGNTRGIERHLRRRKNSSPGRARREASCTVQWLHPPWNRRITPMAIPARMEKRMAKVEPWAEMQFFICTLSNSFSCATSTSQRKSFLCKMRKLHIQEAEKIETNALVSVIFSKTVESGKIGIYSNLALLQANLVQTDSSLYVYI